MTGTPPRLHAIKNRHQLAKAIGIPVKYLIQRAFEEDQSHLYTRFSIRKRSGGERVISAPRWPTANMQNRIRELLEEVYRPSNRVMGFVKGRGIRRNASFHLGKRLILNIDLQDYFPSINFGRIRGRLMAKPYNLTNEVATIIAKICTVDGVLPVGACTSPILANMVTSALDGALSSYAKQRGCIYTRYADDITFSTNRSVFPNSIVRRTHDVAGVEAAPELNELILLHGFQINSQKTRLMTKHMRQEVCGVTCNERLNIRRPFYREVRATLNAWRKHGRQMAELIWNDRFNWRAASSLERSLRGRIEHIIHIRGKNDRVTKSLVDQFNDLEDRSFKDIDYHYVDDSPLGIRESTCLIQCSNTEDCSTVQEMVWSQGSGFIIENGSIITNHHVVFYHQIEEKEVDENGFIKKYITNKVDENGKLLPKVSFSEIKVQFEGSSVEYDVNVVFADEKKDIAVLHPKDSAWLKLFQNRSCRVSLTPPHHGAEVSLVGFPNHATGASCKIAPATITGTTPYEGVEYFTISQIIVQGNSGGPVIDKHGQVIGIATKGVAPNEEVNLAFNGCIPIHKVYNDIINST